MLLRPWRLVVRGALARALQTFARRAARVAADSKAIRQAPVTQSLALTWVMDVFAARIMLASVRNGNFSLRFK